METRTVYTGDLGQAAELLADVLHEIPHATIEYNHTQIEGEEAHVFKICYEVKE